MADSIFYLEDYYSRQDRLEKITDKYIELNNSNLQRKIEIGEKPICLDSFLTLCSELNGSSIDENSLDPTFKDVLTKSLTKLNIQFNYIDTLSFDNESLSDFYNGFFVEFCNKVSYTAMKKEQYNIPPAMCVVYLECLLNNKGYEFNTENIKEAFISADNEFRTYNPNLKDYTYFKNDLGQKMFNFEKGTGNSINLNKYLSDLEAYKNKFLENKNYKWFDSKKFCLSGTEYLKKIYSHDSVGDVSYNHQFNEFICSCEYKGDTGYISIATGDVVNNKLTGLFKFQNDKTGDIKFILTNNLISNLYTDFYTEKLILSDSNSYKVKEYKNFVDYCKDNIKPFEKIQNKIEQFEIKKNFDENFNTLKGIVLTIPESLVDKDSNKTKEKNYEITQSYIFKDKGKNSCHLVIKDYSDLDNPKYFLLKNVEKGIPFYSERKEKFDLKLSIIKFNNLGNEKGK